MATAYLDDYSTCERTHATLRLYSDAVAPDEISARLGLSPSASLKKGEAHVVEGQPAIVHRTHAWFLSSEPHVASKDARRHLDWLLAQLLPVVTELRALMRLRTHGDISCYWLAATRHGGPTLSADQFAGLAQLGLDLWFDVYALTKAP